jgi:hypothetical protein
MREPVFRVLWVVDYVYCTRVLGMSEDEAFKRIRAARALGRYPVVAEAVADGRLHLTAVVLLARISRTSAPRSWSARRAARARRTSRSFWRGGRRVRTSRRGSSEWPSS